ncbi:hypothetical protein, partial [Mycolicibacterium sphagni]|uniref:hypothetical protein n=1 Tax=Mycolicibacterium sphagni TaxID=1786 RepID=UPI0021F3194D
VPSDLLQLQMHLIAEAKARLPVRGACTFGFIATANAFNCRGKSSATGARRHTTGDISPEPASLREGGWIPRAPSHPN